MEVLIAKGACFFLKCAFLAAGIALTMPPHVFIQASSVKLFAAVWTNSPRFQTFFNTAFPTVPASTTVFGIAAVFVAHFYTETRINLAFPSFPP